MNNLAQLLELRTEIKTKEWEVTQIMPDAISEALDLVTDDSQVVFRNKLGKVVMVMRKRIPSIKDSPELARLTELITAAQIDQANRNDLKLKTINQQIAQKKLEILELEKQRENLLNNDRIINLKSRFLEQQEKSSWLEPTLSVYIF